MNMRDRRLIEETFPVKEVSVESAKEKNIRHGHISTLHIWWARRPLAASRATAYAALVPPPSDEIEWQKQRNFIIDLSKWENSNNATLIRRAREEILKANNGTPPKVLDPFAGGGSIPLEALRLGCEVHASDYNPVAVLIEKCTLEYPQRFGHAKSGERGWGEIAGEHENPLLNAVKNWGEWVLAEAKKELAEFYPPDEDGSIPVGYIWARTIPCQNPSCGAEIPLMRQYWLAKKENRKIALSPYAEGNVVRFRIVGDGHEPVPEGFDPEKGTVARAVATCPCCGSTVDANTTRRLFREGRSGERMVAVVLHKPGRSGKRYRIATDGDVEVFRKAVTYLEKKKEELRERWGMEPVPDEKLPPRGTLGFRVQGYNLKTWGDLFNPRQQLALVTFADAVRRAHGEMLAGGMEPEFAKAVAGYLGIMIDRLLTFSSTLARIDNTRETISNMFNRQALGMIWDYAELNPFSEATGDWNSAFEWVTLVINHLSMIPFTQISQGSHNSSTFLPHPDNTFDAVLTDPPYYDNVPYSYLSDFFYVWLKRTLGDLYPELFTTPLTPKGEEIVAYSSGEGGFEEGKRRFEALLQQSFREIHRVLKPDGIAVIVYAHKSTSGWETLINSLLDSGLVITGAWPINTEMQARLRAKESAALASSIYIVARKMEREKVGFYNAVREELKNHLNRKLDRLWQEGISGADFFISAIGSAIEVFGKYEQVMDYEGRIVRADRLLEDVRKIATDYAVRQILHNGFAGEISDLTRFYVLWRWEYSEARVHFDEARKLGQSCGIDVAQEFNRGGVVRKEKEFVRVIGPEERDIEDLQQSRELIDVLHLVLLLWEKGKRNEMTDMLNKSGYGHKESFFRVAQAISETLPIDSKEKKLLDGFLAGRERLKEEMKKASVQARLNL
ncbi:MAG: DUF1156 domain-containing protein [Methanomicrobiales archaeon]|nr:DUF1156 domain-containing protein [Methanomicrobiales archaeon]MDI6877627.1 DUF1156 domain-containing protein [Methanomicrobiales archaeon]